MLNVLAITVGELNEGSTQFRLGQFLPLFRQADIQVTCVSREQVHRLNPADGELQRADIILIQKSLFSMGQEKALRRTGLPLIYDFDDAVWARPGKPNSLLTRWRLHRRLHYWLRQATAVVPANGVLAAYARKFSSRIHPIPMAVDTEAWKPAVAEKTNPDAPFVIGWLGSPGNLPYLEKLHPELQQLQQNPELKIKIRIFCGQRPKFDFPFDYVPYQPNTEAAFIQTLDLGLLPLPDTEHARGKSPIKSLQYLACGVPVMGNFVGATAEICRPAFSIPLTPGQDWAGCIREWREKRDALRAMGIAGREFILQRHSLKTCAGQWIRLFQALYSKAPLPEPENPL